MKTNFHPRPFSGVHSTGLVLGLLLACGGATTVDNRIGGETHFLQRCVDTCEGDLACIAGVCTRSCLVVAAVEECAGLGEGLSAAVSCTIASSEPGDVAVCDVACSLDAECSPLGNEFRCEQGLCREAIQSTVPPESGSDAGDVCAPLIATAEANQTPGSVGLRVRNSTSGPIFLEPYAPCNEIPTPVRVENDGVPLNLLGRNCRLYCDDLILRGLSVGVPDLGCDNSCSGKELIRIDAGAVYDFPDLDTASFVEGTVPSACVGAVREVGCEQAVPWPNGNLTVIASAYRAEDCADPALCDCHIANLPNTMPIPPADPCDEDLVRQAGLTEAGVEVFTSEILGSTLEIVFLGEVR